MWPGPYVSGLFTLRFLPVLRGTQREQRWQRVNYDDLTCHVAVYLCGPQGTTPIRINGVVARGAANQLVGLTRWLVDGWRGKKEAVWGPNEVFSMSSSSITACDFSECMTSLWVSFSTPYVSVAYRQMFSKANASVRFWMYAGALDGMSSKRRLRVGKHSSTHVMWYLKLQKRWGFSLICKITSKTVWFHYCRLPPEGALPWGRSNWKCESTLRRRARERS